MDTATGAAASSAAPRRGRPRLTEGEREETRARILAATEETFARFGFHGVTVARIVDEAGMAKSHFYRFYSGAGEPLDAVLVRLGEAVVTDVVEALESVPTEAGGGGARIMAGAEAYLQWSIRNQHVLPSYTAALHDTTTTVAGIRAGILERIAGVIRRQLADLGLPAVSDDELDVFLSCLEHTSYRLNLRTPGRPDDVQRARGIMVRAGVALLGDQRSWLQALQTPGLIRSRGTV